MYMLLFRALKDALKRNATENMLHFNSKVFVTVTKNFCQSHMVLQLISILLGFLYPRFSLTLRQIVGQPHLILFQPFTCDVKP